MNEKRYIKNKMYTDVYYLYIAITEQIKDYK